MVLFSLVTCIWLFNSSLLCQITSMNTYVLSYDDKLQEWGVRGGLHACMCFRIYFSNFSQSNTSNLFIYLGVLMGVFVSFWVAEI